MDSAFIVTWTAPFPGREKLALEYGMEVNEYWGKLAADGKCSEPEMFFFSDGHGMWMVKGSPDTMLELYLDERSQRLATKGQLLLQDFALDLVKTGDVGARYLLQYAALGQELGII